MPNPSYTPTPSRTSGGGIAQYSPNPPNNGPPLPPIPPMPSMPPKASRPYIETPAGFPGN